jgi:hypothetical protein
MVRKEDLNQIDPRTLTRRFSQAAERLTEQRASIDRITGRLTAERSLQLGLEYVVALNARNVVNAAQVESHPRPDALAIIDANQAARRTIRALANTGEGIFTEVKEVLQEEGRRLKSLKLEGGAGLLKIANAMDDRGTPISPDQLPPLPWQKRQKRRGGDR